VTSSNPNENHRENPPVPNEASLLRAAADEELNAADQERLESRLRERPDDEARVETERRLREACARVMTQIEVPADLRSRVERAIEERADDDEVLERLEAIAERTRDRSFWRQIPPSVRAAAAALILVLGTAFLLFAPGSPLAPRGYSGQLISFMDREHERCWLDAEYLAVKFPITEREEVPEAFQAILGADVSLGDIYTSGLEFVGAGSCAVPGGKSMHLSFRTPGAAPNPGGNVSLFLQKDTGRLNLEPGVTYRLTRDTWFAPADCAIYAWARDGLIYYLVSTDEGACGVGREALDAPERTEQL